MWKYALSLGLLYKATRPEMSQGAHTDQSLGKKP